MMDRDLLDVNVWVALTVPEHTHHTAAKNYLNSHQHAEFAFCWSSALGMIRVLSQTKMIAGEPVTPEAAWEVLNEWKRQPGIIHLPEPQGLHSLLDRWVAEGLATTRNWTDLYLAAFAHQSRARLVTFDKGLSRLTGVTILLLAG